MKKTILSISLSFISALAIPNAIAMEDADRNNNILAISGSCLTEVLSQNEDLRNRNEDLETRLALREQQLAAVVQLLVQDSPALGAFSNYQQLLLPHREQIGETAWNGLGEGSLFSAVLAAKIQENIQEYPDEIVDIFYRSGKTFRLKVGRKVTEIYKQNIAIN